VERFKFSDKNRIKKNPEIVAILRGGNNTRNNFFSLAFQERSILPSSTEAKDTALQPPPETRLGIIVAKRVIKKAHDRNRMKRLIREAFRLEKNRLVKAYDIIVRVTKPCQPQTLDEVRKNFLSLLEKAGLI